MMRFLTPADPMREANRVIPTTRSLYSGPDEFDTAGIDVVGRRYCIP